MMRKAVTILAIAAGVLLMFGLFGCGKQKDQKNSMVEKEGSGINIEVVNHLDTADIWIMKDTPENRKKSLWGTPDLKSLQKDSSEKLALDTSDVSSDNRFIIRMIDENSMMYGCDDLVLSEGYTIVLTEGENITEQALEIHDADGSLMGTYILGGGKL